MTSFDPYEDSVTLQSDTLRLVLAPRHGASVLSFDHIGADGEVPVFCRTPDRIDNAINCAMPIMLPWVNRISSGGVTVDGAFYPLEPNLPGEPFPNHGNGFQSAWTIVGQSRTHIALSLSSKGPGPYEYDALYELRLNGAVFRARIELTNRSDKRLPFGVGFHPWLPRTPETTLQAAAQHVWLEDERYIPTRPTDVSQVPDFDFRSANCLPARWINNSFVGWNGVAEILWPERQLRLVVNSPDAACYHVYSPNDQAGFFCFEPEAHIPDAARLLKAGEAGAPHWLEMGETLVHEVQFAVAS